MVLGGLSRPKWDNFIKNFGLHMRRHPTIQMSELIKELQAVELSRKLHLDMDEVAMITTTSSLPHHPPPMRNSQPHPRRGPNKHQQSTNRQPKTRSSTNRCDHCDHLGQKESECQTKIREDQIVANLLTQLNKGKHQPHSASIEDHFNGDFDHLEANMASLELANDPTWYIDSTTSSHLTRNKLQLTNIVPRPSTSLTTVGGHKIPVLGKGKAVIHGNKALNNVLYVLFVTQSLVSVGKLANSRHIITFDSMSCSVVHSSMSQLLAYSGIQNRRNGLYNLQPRRDLSLRSFKVCCFT